MSRRISIAFVVSQIRRTGPIIVVLDLMKTLPRDLYDLHIIELRPSAEDGQEVRDEFTALGCELHSLNCSLLHLEMKTKLVASQLKSLASSLGIELLHSHTYHPDLICARLSSDFAILSTQHNLSLQDFSHKKGALMGAYMHARLLRALSSYRHIACITHFVRNYYQSRLPQGLCFHTIYNGIDPERFSQLSILRKAELRQELGIDPEHYVMTMVGSLSTRKDPITVIRALQLLDSRGLLPNNFCLLLIGDGPLRKQCCRYAETLLGRIRFVGFSTEPERYMQAADAAITASHSEGFGLNVAEAIMCGLPVVTTTIGPLLELTEDLPSLHALRFAPGHVEACAEAICLCFDAILGEDERKAFSRRFSGSRMGQAYHHLYQAMLKG